MVGQQQDTGSKMYDCARETTSTIVSKSISKDGGNATYRGKVHVDEGAVSLEVLRALRRPHPRRRVGLRDEALHRGRGAGRRDRARGDGLEGRRRPALLPDEPGPVREPGNGDDRERVHRARNSHSADGVRRRVESPDRASDGRLSRLSDARLAPSGPPPGSLRRPTAVLCSQLCRCARNASTFSRGHPRSR